MKLKLPQVEGEINKDDYDFLQKISSSDLVGLLGGDWIKYWRWNNLSKIASKVRAKSEELSLNVNKVAPKFLSDFFEASSLEEDDSIQAMWANLLLNKSVDQTTNGYYITVLRNLEPVEAELINLLYSQSSNSIDTNFDFELVLKSSARIDRNQLSVMIHKLYSFNILRPPINRGIQMGSFPPAVETIEAFRLTEMGIDFCKKCNSIATN
jgi:Abortive infection alpha